MNLLESPSVGVPWWKPVAVAVLLALTAFACWEGVRDHHAASRLTHASVTPPGGPSAPEGRANKYTKAAQLQLDAAITLIGQLERPWLARLAAIQDGHRRGIHLTGLEFTDSGDGALVNGRAASFIGLLNYQNKLAAHDAIETIHLLSHSPFTAPAGSGYGRHAPSIEFSFEIQWKSAS